MSGAILLIATLFVTITCYGSSLYGTAGTDYIDGVGTLVAYDTITGKTTTIAKPTINLRDSDFGRGCYDDKNNILYQVFNEYNSSENNPTFITALYPFNLNNPQNQLPITYLPQLYANQYAGAGLQCTSNPKSGDIYLWGWQGITFPGTHQILLKLSYVDETTALNVTEIKKYPIGINSFASLISGPMSIYDSKRDMIYFAGTCCDAQNLSVYYYVINPQNGDIVKTLNYDEGEWPLTTVAYDSKLDMFIGLWWTGQKVDNDNFVYIYRMVDPGTLNVIKQYNITDIKYDDWCQWDWISTLDVSDGVMYNIIFKEPEKNMSCGGLMYGYFVPINVTDGSVLNQTMFCEVNINETCPISIQYVDG
eukprot:400988_1